MKDIEKIFAIQDLKYERSVMATCSASLFSRIKSLLLMTSGRYATPAILNYEREFLGKMCDREQELIKFFFEQIFKSLDEIVNVLENFQTQPNDDRERMTTTLNKVD